MRQAAREETDGMLIVAAAFAAGAIATVLVLGMWAVATGAED